jgi:ribose transport system permease protein
MSTQTGTPRATASSASPRRPAAGKSAWAQRYSLVGFLLAMFALFSILRPDTFPTSSNLLVLLASQSVVVVLAIAVTFTLRLGDLDLSFGAVTATTAVVFAVANVHEHWSVAVCIVLCLGFGAVVGAVNALLAVVVGLNSFVATLGTMTVVEGIGYWLSSSQVIAGVSPSLQSFMQTGPGGVPGAAFIGWGLFIVVWLVYEFTPFGRYLLFIGGNKHAANLLGLRVRLIRSIAYVVGGTLYGLAGILLVGTVGSADPTVGAQYLLAPLAGAFLGTTAIQVGRFNALGTLLATYALAIISSGLLLFGASAWISYIFNGAALIVGVSLARFAPARAGGQAAVSITE